MGSKKAQTIGYKYYAYGHFVLCHGPIDAITKISFSDKDAYTNEESKNKTIYINKHYFNASREQIRHLFNQSRVFISTSNSEGLNLTPVEATLCGCPAVVCDGAIGELFIDGHTCYIAKEGDYFDVLNCAIALLS